jgi:hypothetical protein
VSFRDRPFTSPLLLLTLLIFMLYSRVSAHANEIKQILFCWPQDQRQTQLFSRRGDQRSWPHNSSVFNLGEVMNSLSLSVYFLTCTQCQRCKHCSPPVDRAHSMSVDLQQIDTDLTVHSLHTPKHMSHQEVEDIVSIRCAQHLNH